MRSLRYNKEKYMTFSGITTQSTDAVFQSLRTSERGLSSVTAQQLLKQYGLNQVRSQEHTWRDILARQFT